MIPARWAAPEALETLKFSQASDVWSFGIVAVEVAQDGATPYPGFRSNPEVMAKVMLGMIHPKPSGCSDDMYVHIIVYNCNGPSLSPPLSFEKS
jgi:serine/threonine protein kinase